ncbi:MAG: hypothetical protein R3F19_26350 [Verrucomicrobiales bacterium]
MRYLCYSFSFFACLWSTLAQQASPPAFPKTSNGWELASTLNHAPLKEASGFAASIEHPGVLWTHNDGGAGSNIFAIDIATGAVVATCNLPDIPNLDWEDAMTVTLESKHLVAIADIGDNERRRHDCVIHLFQETPSSSAEPPSLRLYQSIRFRYPDGNRYDAESAAFDPLSGSFLVLTKSKSETLLFEISRPAKAETVVEAKLITPLAKPTAYPKTDALVSLKRGIFGVSATAADISPDGSLLAVLTYTECLIYKRSSDENDWHAAAQRAPLVIPLPGVYQAEALCFSTKGDELYVTSENSPSPLYTIAVPIAQP